MTVMILLIAAAPLSAANYDPASNPARLSDAASGVRYSPAVILSNYTVTGGGLVAGGYVTIAFEFTNTSRLSGVFDLVVSFGTSSATMSPVYGQTNQSFIIAIPTGGVAEVEKTFNIAMTSQDIIEMPVRISYQGVGTGQEGANMTIYLPLFSAGSLSTQINIDNTVYTGAEVSLAGFCGNLSRREIADLEMTVEGDFSGGRLTERLGSLVPGEQIPISRSLVFGQENPAAVVSVSFAFSDLDGNRVEMPAQIIRVMVIDRPETTFTVNNDPMRYLIIGGAAVAACVVIALSVAAYRRRGR